MTKRDGERGGDLARPFRASLALSLIACAGAPAPATSSATDAPSATATSPTTARAGLIAPEGARVTEVPEPTGRPAPTGLTGLPSELSAAPAGGESPDPGTADLPPADPLPEGFSRIPDPRYDDTDHGPCGELTVFNELPPPRADGLPGEPSVRVVDPAGRLVYRARGRQYRVTPDASPSRMSLVADICGDLTGDDLPELILTERTMGAHCCYTHYVVSMTRPTKTLLTWEKGDAGTGLRPVQAKPDPRYELVSSVVVDPPGLDLAYAVAPLLPIVFQLEGDTYRPRTFRFSDFLRQRRRSRRERCRDHPAWCDESVYIDWGEALILGDWPAERKRVKASPEVIDELNRATPATLALLKRSLGI